MGLEVYTASSKKFDKDGENKSEPEVEIKLKKVFFVFNHSIIHIH